MPAPDRNQYRYTFLIPYDDYLWFVVNKIAAAILLIAFFGQTFDKVFFYLGYYIDNSDYASNCVNTSRPALHCEGKCQLMKKIREHEQKDHQSPERKLNNKVEVLSSKSFFAAAPPLVATTRQQHAHPAHSGLPIDMPSSFFHPPAA